MTPPTLDGQPLPAFPCYPNKRPACANGHKDATTDPHQIEVLWAGRRGLLVAVPTGGASGIAVLDIDAAGMVWVTGAELPFTRQHQTRSGGQHLIFRHRPGLRCSQSVIAPGVDVRAEGGYVIWWPASGYAVSGDAVADWPEGLASLRNCSGGSPPLDTPGWDAPTTVSEEVTHFRNFKQTAERWSREETFALFAARNAQDRLARTPIGRGLREKTINAEAFSLGRLVARGWLSGDMAFLSLWLGAQSCRYDKDHGIAVTLRLIRRGLMAGMQRPYPDVVSAGSPLLR